MASTEARIVPLTENWIEDWVRLGRLAFIGAAAYTALFPKGLTQVTLDYGVEQLRKQLAGGEENTKWMMILDPATGELAAIARWVRHAAGEAAKAYDPEELLGAPPDTNLEARAYYLRAVMPVLSKVIGDRPHWYLGLLATAPQHRGKGYAKVLLEYGTRQADEAGVECLLDATDVARPLYESVGFEPVVRNSYDFSSFGVTEPWYTTAMLRAPRSVRDARDASYEKSGEP